MTLRQKQSAFVRLLPLLFRKAWELGFELTLGEAWRSPAEAERLAELGKGIPNSLHKIRLAIDLNLFKNGVYLTSTESHRALGEYWKSLSTKEFTCAWGGDFEGKKKDGNHYSFEHNGVK